MPRVSAAFFAIGVLFLIAGMIWGMIMGNSENFILAPAHAHLNLLGWVTMAIYGTFYALTRDTLAPRLAWTNFVLAVLGVVVMIPSLACYLSGRPQYGAGIAVGSVLCFLALLVFGISVARELMRSR
jgi:hypothetical protein